MNAGQDSNLHPSQSGQVPLPLDHLHSMLSPCLNSYPRALSMTLTLLHMCIAMHLVFRKQMHMCIVCLRCSCTCTLMKLPSLSKYVSQIAYMNEINNFLLEQFIKQEKECYLYNVLLQQYI